MTESKPNDDPWKGKIKPLSPEDRKRMGNWRIFSTTRRGVARSPEQPSDSGATSESTDGEV